MSDSQPNLRTVNQSPKSTSSVKKYGKEKLMRFKKSEQFNFNEVYDKIKSIGLWALIFFYFPNCDFKYF